MTVECFSNAQPADAFAEFRQNVDELTQAFIDACRQGRSPGDATLDLLQRVHREDRNWVVVHLTFAIAALAHQRALASADTVTRPGGVTGAPERALLASASD
ncbi:hypothetical protein [Amycolatopsis regifaucium]|uniref:Uncharacterized protein n=1 Tax=Amycolatopsis regifaucium TaxID=546365 RepID=A0A154MWI9_9PSEU|nr:hypothetical protein [Amycolatopsis regifaucium]KZB88662.1 hypothetical protein AVL48_00870 [Amycolatopsis regifaucium]OKA07167.1 hypothetical protein ATP06_0214920 [Amycolatopsis regifaucium]